MGLWNFRSLLLAAIVLCNSISWTSSRHHYAHNVLGHRSRHRRQGAGLFLPASYVIPGGEGSGAWGDWGEVTPCSRSCGGGVASQKRICLQFSQDGRPLCTGGDTKYFSCETADCPAGSKDFRSQQCSEYDNQSFRGSTYRWVPYTKAPNPCELNCMPHGERFYYRHKQQVIDGTRCNDESFDVCVNGVCQPVGCDVMLGSYAREDKCRECRGNGTNCHTAKGIIDSQDFRKGYNDVLLIPEGATSIFIHEIRASNNYLALRGKQSNVYYLNGDYHIDFPRSLMIAGALWHYERSQQGFAAPDKLRCLGPTTEPLYLSLLLQDENVGIEYEYSIPIAMAPPPNQQYNWVHEEFTPCSATCGGGFQTREVSCRSREELDIVDESLCDEGLKPPTNQTCNTQACDAQWVEGPWSPCSKPCGEGGTRSRQVHCEKIISNGLPSVVPDKECFDRLGPKPELYQECNKNASCPTWFTGPWKPCDKLCGEGKQTRQVVCHQKKSGRVEVFSDDACADEKPQTEQPCILHHCLGVDWVISDWSGCDSCLSKFRTRVAECATKDHQVVNATLCAYHPTPVLQEPCDQGKLPPCTVQWYATQWSNCSVECGKGVQQRRVFCGLFNGESVIKVDNERCENETKYKDSKPCEVPTEKCPAKWFAGPWSECTKKCGGGDQFRKIMCLRGGKEVLNCDEDSILSRMQSCNTKPCDIDETLPVNFTATTIMDDDYEDCEEEDLTSEEDEVVDEGEIGAEETSYTGEDMMFSDEPSTTVEGSGFGSTSFTEIESEFTDATGSGSEPTIKTTADEEGSGTEVTLADTEETSTTDVTESSVTEESVSTVTEETGSTLTEETGSTESGATEVSSETSSESTTEQSGSTETGSTEITETGSTDTLTNTATEASSTEFDSSSSTTDSSTIISTTSEEDYSSTTTDYSSSSTTESSTIISTTSEEDYSSTTTDYSSKSTDKTTVPPTTEDDYYDVHSSTTVDSSSTYESTTESGTTESGSTETTDGSSTTETGGSTETTEVSVTDLTETGSTGSTETGSTATTETSESGSTETTGTGSTETTESGSTETTESGSTETTESGSTETTESGSTETTESGATEVTGSTETEETGVTSESSSTSEGETESTPWDWSTTLEILTKKPKCKPRKKSAKCIKSIFGCCPDNKSEAGGPFDEGCPKIPPTCDKTKFGCCPDGVSPATGDKNKGCPIPPCNETLFGCCKSDNKTAAEGNDQEGCPPPPPPCKSSKYGCCKDGKTQAKGAKSKGCPETEPKKVNKGCAGSVFGCCFDNKTEATGPNEEGCPCDVTEFGCCPDGVEPARSAQMEGCVMSCNTSAFGCCPDKETPAHGPDYEGCCLQYPFGCCPDNYRPAEGPHLEGCGCIHAHYGCCPDNITIARGPDNKGCGCEYTEHGCCPDRHTEASGPNFEGCGCHTHQFGCCPDGSTIAVGPNLQGCHCQQSKFGCCGDGQTAATGPDQQGCDCSTSQYGCCPDGQTVAKGEKFLECTDVPENRQAACALPTDRGSCRNYTVYWFYDNEYGGCSRFWYGGCEGNGNKFSTKEECEDICVQPPPKDSCKLPKVKGACKSYLLRWYYDTEREQCQQFVYGGCLGNSNNFETRELCQGQCEPARSDDTCKLPIERGSCAGNFRRWGFNPEAGRCEQFIWGGCEGNNNRFGSEAACVQKCDPPGALKPQCNAEPQEMGICSSKVPAWSFSQTENRCIPFYYSGCGGSDNRFDSEDQCSETCPSAFVKDVCTLPATIGECANYREKWYYDTSHKRCRQFYYGGCGGNGNNFNTERECESRCSDHAATTTVQPATPAPFNQEYCFLELDPGPCNVMEQQWAYDSSLGSCVSFEYGGCGGNRNRFPSIRHCQYYCGTTQDICQLPMRAGPCDASLMRWFYDAASDTCSQFTYGGCEGNGNRFESRDACERRCRTGAGEEPTTLPATTTTTVRPVEVLPSECYVSPSLEDCVGAGPVWYLEPSTGQCSRHDNQPSGPYCRHTGVFPSQEFCERACGSFRNLDVCRYGLDAGPCREFEPKFYFDQQTQACKPFNYGGCLGGPNRFSSQYECQQICRTDRDPCRQTPEIGNCLDSIHSWYYDSNRDQCHEFVYTGCNGNDNRFATREECEGVCVRTPSNQETTTKLAPLTPAQPQLEAECQAPPSLSPCGERISVFYYDAATSSCVQSDIGGCRYANSFRTEEECERRCGAFRGLDPCRHQLDPGPCRAAVPKVYYDASTGRCLSYTYGGCNGGPNRFSTTDECDEVCGANAPEPSCLMPVSTGDQCSSGSSRWYYSISTGDCQIFSYSGCGGNDNNFVSYDQCAQSCIRTGNDLGNEVLPACDRYNEECASLQCEYSVQRTRTAEGCERCSCVPVEVDCRPLALECQNLKCNYGMLRTVGSDGCERCQCTQHPCATQRCRDGERCVIVPDASQSKYIADCRVVTKPGSCPAAELIVTEGSCRRECNDDADCGDNSKCCASGCSQRCVPPASDPRPTTPSPELPQAPQANSAETKPEVTSSEGGTATLQCLFQGNPPPKITWRRGEITIDGSVGRYRLLSSGALEIVSLYRNDSGVYICVADNGLGVARQEIHLQVNAPVEGPAGISGEASELVTGTLGQPVYVRCLAYGWPQPSIYWYRGALGGMIPYSSSLYEARDNTLLIRALSLETLGEYACQAYNGIGKAATWSVVVRAWAPEGVYYNNPYLVQRDELVVVTPREPTTVTTTTEAPQTELHVYTVPVKTRISSDVSTVAPGAELNLPCEVDGYPYPVVHWTKDGVVLEPNDTTRVQVTDARLTISAVTANDSGVYGCHARNSYSSHYSTVQIEVKGLFIPPSCTDNHYFAKCDLIVKSRFCSHKYYSDFCCKSCVEAGQLNPLELRVRDKK